MNKMKSAYMYAMMAAMLESSTSAVERNSLKPKDIDITPKEPPKPKGLKQFHIDGVEVWAINQKNAERKAKNIK